MITPLVTADGYAMYTIDGYLIVLEDGVPTCLNDDCPETLSVTADCPRVSSVCVVPE